MPLPQVFILASGISFKILFTSLFCSRILSCATAQKISLICSPLVIQLVYSHGDRPHEPWLYLDCWKSLSSICSKPTVEVLFITINVGLRRMDCTFRARQEEFEETRKALLFHPFFILNLQTGRYILEEREQQPFKRVKKLSHRLISSIQKSPFWEKYHPFPLF